MFTQGTIREKKNRKNVHGRRPGARGGEGRQNRIRDGVQSNKIGESGNLHGAKGWRRKNRRAFSKKKSIAFR